MEFYNQDPLYRPLEVYAVKIVSIWSPLRITKLARSCMASNRLKTITRMIQTKVGSFARAYWLEKVQEERKSIQKQLSAPKTVHYCPGKVQSPRITKAIPKNLSCQPFRRGGRSLNQAHLSIQLEAQV